MQPVTLWGNLSFSSVEPVPCISDRTFNMAMKGGKRQLRSSVGRILSCNVGSFGINLSSNK